jgi:hypothetical protein
MTESMTKKRTSKLRSKRRSPTPAGAPVTLDEAMRLAGITPDSDEPTTRRPAHRIGKAKLQKATRRLVTRATSSATTPPTILSIEAERARFAAHRQELIEQRTRDYLATMQILKARGVIAAPPAAGKRGKRIAATASTAIAAPRAVLRPLQVIAEGDSWFDYPVPFFGGGIIKRLPDRIGVPVLDLANAGDEVRYMLGVEQRAELEAHLRAGCPAGGPWDVLLFSGGGNDIVGDPMTLWIRDYEDGKTAAELLHGERYRTALDLVRAGYEDLIALRDRISPTTHLLFHTYDFAIPDGRGICGKGPWLRPTFEARGYPRNLIRFEVVQEMLRRFAAMLQSLARPGSVTVIDGQGLLPPGIGSWHNELHPSERGYMAFADRFRDELRRLFPSRLP